jgi:hypothetical protein
MILGLWHFLHQRRELVTERRSEEGSDQVMTRNRGSRADLSWANDVVNGQANVVAVDDEAHNECDVREIRVIRIRLSLSTSTQKMSRKV